MIALQSHFGTVGVQRLEGGDYQVVMCVNQGDGSDKLLGKIPYEKDTVYLKIAFDFTDSRDIATFFYSEDGQEWLSIGEPLKMKYTLDHFMGYRVGIFNYPTEQVGGFVDVDYFCYEKAE
ncbi:hypothetical protein [Bacillus sp. JCM 19034]|uniref:beta-xylosidase family glycoside hydrolase n=1 Tax=Bacillus sp. JCM 19034 TaxID=1481928 RepID=UPI000A4836B3